MKLLIRNKFFSSVLGAFAAIFGFAFLLPLNTFSVYITSYINLKYEYITMHYGLFINLIFMFANTFSNSLWLFRKYSWIFPNNNCWICNYFCFKFLFYFSTKYLAMLFFIFDFGNWSRNS